MRQNLTQRSKYRRGYFCLRSTHKKCAALHGPLVHTHPGPKIPPFLASLHLGNPCHHRADLLVEDIIPPVLVTAGWPLDLCIYSHILTEHWTKRVWAGTERETLLTSRVLWKGSRITSCPLGKQRPGSQVVLEGGLTWTTEGWLTWPLLTVTAHERWDGEG